MTKVISFISRKGGSGKTTNAVNLANYLHHKGKKIVLVETDTNYTLNSLRQLELFKTKKNISDFFHIVASEDHVVATEIKKLIDIGDYDYILVDSAGKTTDKGIRALVLVTDLACVTTSIDQHDLLVTYQTIQDLRPAQQINTTLKIVVIPNRIDENTGRWKVNKALKELNSIVINKHVKQHTKFKSSSTISFNRKYTRTAREILKHLT